MGWTYQYRAKGTSDREFFEPLLNKGSRIIACNSAGGFHGEFYAAVENSAGEVSVLVALKAWSPHEYYNFGYKDMDDTAGPIMARASQAVLDALTPTTNEHALDFRARAQANLDAKKTRPTLRRGSVIHLNKPVKFANGESYEFFRVGNRGRIEQALTSPDSLYGLRVRFGNFRNYEFNVL